MIDIFRDTATRDKLIFPLAITCILSHVHVTFPLSTPFYAMGAINKESIRRSDAYVAAKWPRVKFTSTDVAPTSRPSFSFAFPSSYSSRAEVFLIAIMDQFQLMCADFGSHFDHLFDEMCQMNTSIGCTAHRQSRPRWFSSFSHTRG